MDEPTVAIEKILKQLKFIKGLRSGSLKDSVEFLVVYLENHGRDQTYKVLD